jgi:hypothetical protein
MEATLLTKEILEKLKEKGRAWSFIQPPTS